MIYLYRLIGAPLRLLPVDLMSILAITFIAFSLMAGPVFGQDPSTQPTHSPTATGTPSLAPAQTIAASPFATVAPSAAPFASPAATPLSAAAAAATDVGELPSGGSVDGDPCLPQPTPNAEASFDPEATPVPRPNLCPAQPNGADPLALLSWLFTPIFQAIFLGLAFLYSVTGDIGVAIILLTIFIRILLIPVFRAQIVSQRRMQMLQPDIKIIQQKYKGDRARISAEQMQLYKARGVNPASGCLPAVLQLVLLLPMYQVFNQGLNAPDISAMLAPFGQQFIDIVCQDPGNLQVPCIDPNIPWLAWIPKMDLDPVAFLLPGYPGGLPSNNPEIFLPIIGNPGDAFVFGLSLLAATSAALQLVQTRMMMTRTDDPQQKTQQRIFLLLPAFSLVYGAILPAGLFIYWITTTVFSIGQQFLINGYGGLFPLFGWTPRIAVDHQPRFPVSMPEPKPASPTDDEDGPDNKSTKRSTKESAEGTIRPARRKSRRRGRRR